MRPSWRHLARRFFATGTARPLTAAEQAEIDAWLPDPRWRQMFAEQPPTDQRHAYRCGRAMSVHAPNRVELVQAAVLHDIGKRHAGLGIVRRTVSGAATKLGIRLPGAFARYADHGAVGAEELESAGAPPLVVTFTRHHHGERPDELPAQDWNLLVAVDDER